MLFICQNIHTLLICVHILSCPHLYFIWILLFLSRSVCNSRFGISLSKHFLILGIAALCVWVPFRSHMDVGVGYAGSRDTGDRACMSNLASTSLPGSKQSAWICWSLAQGLASCTTVRDESAVCDPCAWSMAFACTRTGVI